jgi:hypothetical protein
MFIQVIEGTTLQPEALHEQFEKWKRDLMPGAIGYLGSAGGCTQEGDCILVVRFDSADAARANSERPEQDAWWHETEMLFDGPVRFHDSEHVQIMRRGRLEDAGFVQVLEGHVTDPDMAAELEAETVPLLADARPDLIGTVAAYFDDGEFTEVAYFTSEIEARLGESRRPDEEMAELMQRWDDVLEVDRYLDLAEPWLVAPLRPGQSPALMSTW